MEPEILQLLNILQHNQVNISATTVENGCNMYEAFSNRKLQLYNSQSKQACHVL